MSSNIAMALVLPMNSPGHRANILKHDFNAVGIGHAGSITVELFGGR